MRAKVASSIIKPWPQSRPFLKALVPITRRPNGQAPLRRPTASQPECDGVDACMAEPWPSPYQHWLYLYAGWRHRSAAAKTMTGYPRTADPDPTKPYVMWP